MSKYFIFNLLLTFAIVFLGYSGFLAYQAGNQLILFIALALLVVMVYLKTVLLKVVKKEAKKRAETPKPIVKNKKGAK